MALPLAVLGLLFCVLSVLFMAIIELLATGALARNMGTIHWLPELMLFIGVGCLVAAPVTAVLGYIVGAVRTLYPSRD